MPYLPKEINSLFIDNVYRVDSPAKRRGPPGAPGPPTGDSSTLGRSIFARPYFSSDSLLNRSYAHMPSLILYSEREYAVGFTMSNTR